MSINKTEIEEDKVSVIVPVYNVEEYIRECIKSIQVQTYSNLEIIVVNDGTKDKRKLQVQVSQPSSSHMNSYS